MSAHVAWLTRSFGIPRTAPFRRHDLEVLSGVLESVSVPAGSKILVPGQTADVAYVVERGEIELFVKNGPRRMLVAIQRSGGAFGDIPMMCEKPFPYLAVARTDAVLLKLNQDDLTGLLEGHPSIALRWLSSLIKRLEQSHQRIIELTMGDLRARVLALLADAVLTGPRNDLSLTQSEIGALLGATRSSVNRVLRKLGKEGLISQEYGRISVHEPDRLVELAGGPKVPGPSG